MGLLIGEIGVCYVGGLVDNHTVSEVHKISFLDIEELCKDYEYKPDDLIHYKIPDKSLDEGLRLISSDHDISQMISHHVGHGLVELYLVSFPHPMQILNMTMQKRMRNIRRL